MPMTTHDHHRQYQGPTGWPADLQPVSCARQATLSFAQPLPAAQVEACLSAFLTNLTQALQARGCRLIGHIKLLAQAADAQLLLSVTRFDQQPEARGILNKPVDTLHLVLNAIVFGFDEVQLAEVMDQALSELMVH